MKTISMAALVSGALILMTGVTGCDTGGTWGSCHLGMICYEYTGVSWDSRTIMARCDGYQGEYRTGNCPEEDLVGACIRDPGDEREYVEHFYSPFFSAEDAQDECENEGDVWQPVE